MEKSPKLYDIAGKKDEVISGKAEELARSAYLKDLESKTRKLRTEFRTEIRNAEKETRGLFENALKAQAKLLETRASQLAQPDLVENVDKLVGAFRKSPEEWAKKAEQSKNGLVGSVMRQTYQSSERLILEEAEIDSREELIEHYELDFTDTEIRQGIGAKAVIEKLFTEGKIQDSDLRQRVWDHMDETMATLAAKYSQNEVFKASIDAKRNQLTELVQNSPQPEVFIPEFQRKTVALESAPQMAADFVAQENLPEGVDGLSPLDIENFWETRKAFVGANMKIFLNREIAPLYPDQETPPQERNRQYKKAEEITRQFLALAERLNGLGLNPDNPQSADQISVELQKVLAQDDEELKRLGVRYLTFLGFMRGGGVVSVEFPNANGEPIRWGEDKDTPANPLLIALQRKLEEANGTHLLAPGIDLGKHKNDVPPIIQHPIMTYLLPHVNNFEQSINELASYVAQANAKGDHNKAKDYTLLLNGISPILRERWANPSNITWPKATRIADSLGYDQVYRKMEYRDKEGQTTAYCFNPSAGTHRVDLETFGRNQPQEIEEHYGFSLGIYAQDANYALMPLAEKYHAMRQYQRIQVELPETEEELTSVKNQTARTKRRTELLKTVDEAGYGPTKKKLKQFTALKAEQASLQREASHITTLNETRQNQLNQEKAKLQDLQAKAETVSILRKGRAKKEAQQQVALIKELETRLLNEQKQANLDRQNQLDQQIKALEDTQLGILGGQISLEGPFETLTIAKLANLQAENPNLVPQTQAEFDELMGTAVNKLFGEISPLDQRLNELTSKQRVLAERVAGLHDSLRTLQRQYNLPQNEVG